MKSCIEWRKSFKYLPQIDQFNIDFRNKQIKLNKFLDIYAKSQRVNIRLPEEYTKDDIDLLIAAYQKGYNIAVILPGQNLQKIISVPFYFSVPAYTWDRLLTYISLGVSDIFISGDLAFELDKVSSIAKKENIKIRCYANIAQVDDNLNKYNDGFKQFFIRPEDVDIYGEYVDVIEFYDSIEQQNVLYEVYFKDKEWNGKLREIIKGMDNQVNNYYILGKEFAQRRIKCSRKCLKGERCQLCERTIELANSLEKSKNYQVFKRR